MIASPPASTYRLQLTKEFGFDAAAATIPYLKSLGISHVYASPFFKSRPGSTHGYDILDHTTFNPELGGETGFQRLSDALQRADMGLIVDFVPNHMCVEGVRNDWWWNALEFGPRGRHAAHFDIDWQALPGRPRILLPILGKAYGEALKDGEIQLTYSDGAFAVSYFDHRFPICLGCYASILRQAAKAADAGTLIEFAERAVKIEHSDDAEGNATALKREVQRTMSPLAIEAVMSHYNSQTDVQAAERLHRLLERQYYRLADWRLAGSQINYRRFFDINSLAGLRVERKETFAALHPLVARLLKEGCLQGLRIDHIDGLFDPADYCRRLQALFSSLGCENVYLIVEKILGEGEELPSWPGVAGTTGYEWMNAISRTIVDPAGLERLKDFWDEVSPAAAPFEEVLRTAKQQVLAQLFAGEFNSLTQLLSRIAAGHRSTRDLPPDRLREALRSYIIEFPVYRTYAAGDGMPEPDRHIVAQTIGRVRDKIPKANDPLLDFLHDVLTLDLLRRQSGHSSSRVRRFAMKLQQLTGPVMAKSLEDTALYRDHRLLALNEVGNEPSLPPLGIAQFHDRLRERLEHFPHGLTATATHDTKRGEDARMRILAIAELADEWREHVPRWKELNERHVTVLAGKRAPSVEHEYMLYQAMIGAWPEHGPAEEFVRRLSGYALKAAREGKRESSWLEPDREYEAGLQRFIEKLCDPRQSANFLDSFQPFADRCALIGALYSLSQLVLKATMPGVPDFYQGTELWDLSFVDPDNRRPVHFAKHAQELDQLSSDWNKLLHDWRSGRVKLWLTSSLLRFRNANPLLFSKGAYAGIDTGASDTIGFTRTYGDEGILVLARRRFAQSTRGGREVPSTSERDSEIRVPPGWLAREQIVGPGLSLSQTKASMSTRVLMPFPVAVITLERGAV